MHALPRNLIKENLNSLEFMTLRNSSTCATLSLCFVNRLWVMSFWDDAKNPRKDQPIFEAAGCTLL
jgi:hypothetical protein